MDFPEFNWTGWDIDAFLPDIDVPSIEIPTIPNPLDEVVGALRKIAFVGLGILLAIVLVKKVIL